MANSVNTKSLWLSNMKGKMVFLAKGSQGNAYLEL